MMRMIWIAGPVNYQTKNNYSADGSTIAACRWEFVGCTGSGELRRWSVRFVVETRKFSRTSLKVERWEQQHRKRLFDLYRPSAVLLSTLRSRSLLAAMKSLLTNEEIAELTTLSIRGGKPDG